MITRWHVDNDLSFAGPDVESFAAELVEQATSRVPYDSDTNPVAERQSGTVKRATMAALAYAGAPAVLWPWAMSQYEHIRHFISTEAIQPPMSPFMLAHPEAGPANLSWAKPLFCDVTVHLPSRDSQGKLAYTGSDGCYLGRASSVGTSRRLVRSVPCRKQDSQFDVVSLLLLTLRLSRRQSSRSSFATRLPKMPTSTDSRSSEAVWPAVRDLLQRLLRIAPV